MIRMPRRYVRAAQGVVLALGSPLGWFGIRLLKGWSVERALATEPGLFLYLGLGTMLAFGVFGYYVGRHEDEFRHSSIQDFLTGLYNAGYFHLRLDEEVAQAARQSRPVSLILLDLDHFKRINDEHGHREGDRVLQAVAATLRARRRRGEIVARVGGEEFCIILPLADRLAARRAAERFRMALERIRVRTAGGAEVTITGSFGVATAEAGEEVPAEMLFRRADAAMYAAKAAGRNCVRLHRYGDDVDAGTPPAPATVN